MPTKARRPARLALWSVVRPVSAAVVAISEEKDVLKTFQLISCFPFIIVYDYFNQRPHGALSKAKPYKYKHTCIYVYALLR